MWSFEITSPILYSAEENDQYDELIQSLEEQGLIFEEPSSAGVHVHIGVPYIHPAEEMMMILAFSKIEREYREKIGTSPSREKEISETGFELLDFINLNAASVGESRDPRVLHRWHEEILKFYQTRSSGLLPFTRHGTMELRLLNSTFDRKKRREFRDFARQFVYAIRTKSPRFVDLMKKYEGESTIPLAEFMAAIRPSNGKN